MRCCHGETKMMENAKTLVRDEECTKCGACASVCPYELYGIEGGEFQLRPSFEMECIECGHCTTICPVDIIRLKAHANEALKALPNKDNLLSYESLLNLIHVRRSVRNFKKEAIPKELVTKLLELARYTATGHNEENICYTIVQDPALLERVSSEIKSNIMNLI